MTHRFSFSFRDVTGLLLVAMATYGMGCTLEGAAPVDSEMFDNPMLEGADLGGGGDPNTQNHLKPTCLFDDGVQRTVRALGAGRLASEQPGALPAMPYMPGANDDPAATSCRHDFLDILIGCALPAGASLEDLEDQVPLRGPKTYVGQIGLAPDWETRALTTEEKELVTACALARTNRFGKTVRIMLEGDSPALTNDPYDYDYSYVESTVWGNMFDSKTPLEPTRSPEKLMAARAFEAHVCRNHATAWSVDAAFRVCDEGGCGFIEHGDCDATSSACSGPEGSRPAYCNAWHGKLTAYLQSSTPELYDEPRTLPHLPFVPRTLRAD